jgi:hypothetical protein
VPERDFRDAIIKDVRVAQGEPFYDPLSFVLNACRACAYLHDGAPFQRRRRRLGASSSA